MPRLAALGGCRPARAGSPSPRGCSPWLRLRVALPLACPPPLSGLSGVGFPPSFGRVFPAPLGESGCPLRGRVFVGLRLPFPLTLSLPSVTLPRYAWARPRSGRAKPSRHSGVGRHYRTRHHPLDPFRWLGFWAHFCQIPTFFLSATVKQS